MRTIGEQDSAKQMHHTLLCSHDKKYEMLRPNTKIKKHIVHKPVLISFSYYLKERIGVVKPISCNCTFNWDPIMHNGSHDA